MYKFSFPTCISLLLIFFSACSQERTKKPTETPAENLGPVVEEKKEPHKYGGWYCPDNFGFVPVDIQKLDEVPAVSNRLPTEEELENNMSLIKVDTEKYPDARALEMDLPRVARIYSKRKGIHELIIVIQAIVVQEDTVLGWRYMNGGNGSGWLTDVTFLSEDEVAEMGSQPYYYSKSVLKANTEQIWGALIKTDYFKELGEKFNKRRFFSTPYDPEDYINFDVNTEELNATGYVGMVYGNYYLHIDYSREGFHYSEKMLIMESQEDNTTEFFFAAGPYPKGFEKQQLTWQHFMEAVKTNSEAD